MTGWVVDVPGTAFALSSALSHAQQHVRGKVGVTPNASRRASPPGCLEAGSPIYARRSLGYLKGAAAPWRCQQPEKEFPQVC
jgi:hypothetical protein